MTLTKMTPPKCPVTGKHIRWLLLLAVLSYFVYFIVHGLEEPPSARTVHICDNDDRSALTQCDSLDDAATCAGMTDADGNVAACIESSCGYYLFPHIAVSIAGSSEPYDAAAATAARSFLSVAMIFYSVLAYVLPFAYLVLVLATGDLVPLTRLVVMGVISLPNEVVFKQLIQQNRPLGSCLYFASSHGMPSGHAATSVGLLTYLLLELLVYHPNGVCGFTRQKEEQRSPYSFELGYGWREQAADDEQRCGTRSALDGAADAALLVGAGDDSGNNDSVPPGPRSERRESSHAGSSAPSAPSRWLALWYFVLLFPVPFSRVYLHDHLRNQVLAGSCVGIVISLMWYLGFVRKYGTRIIEWRTSEWGMWWGVKLGSKEGFFLECGCSLLDAFSQTE